jgi:hypothetical protein
MTGNESDALASHLADDRRCRRFAERRTDLHRLGVLEERPEARPAEDADLRDRHRAKARWSPAASS